MLVEVKNFHQGNDTRRPFELDADYVRGLVRYSQAMNCNLMLAVYWSRWNICTLVRHDDFEDCGDKRRLDMFTAIKANHMASLGDYSIGTRFPLSLIMRADKGKPRSFDTEGKGSFTISKVEFYCAGQHITDPLEQNIAAYLMFFGTWE